MAVANVISVNPGKKSLGAMNFEFMQKVARTCRPMTQAIHTPRFKTVCNFIFGINKSVTSAWSAKLLLCRSLVAAFFIAYGIFAIVSGASGINHAISIFNIAIGGMILLGLFARIAGFAAMLLNASIAITAALGYVWHLSASEIPIFEMQATIQALLTGIIAITGPGRYSLDQLLRRAIFRRAKYTALRRQRRRARLDSAVRLSYKAWQAM